MSAATITPAGRRNRPFAWVQQSLTLAWRNTIRIKENPEVPADVTFAFALAVCWIWVFLGLKLKTAQAVQGIAVLVMFAMTFGSNVFVQPDTLPGSLKPLVDVNPVIHLVDAMRALMLGGDPQKPLLLTLAWMAGIVAIFAPLAIRAYRQRT